MMNLKELVEHVINITKDVGEFIKIESKKFTKDKIEHKGYNDLVSYVDKEAERILIQELQSILPESGFIAEEGTSTKKGNTYNWIIDPLDGTTNFSHGLPIYSISIALMKAGNIVLGVVYEINKDECFHAVENDHAYCNGEIINVSNVQQLNGSLLATGFPYSSFEKMDTYLNILNEFMQKTHGLRRMGSAAVDLAYVACGRFEGFFEYNLNAWDVAAGAFIIQRAGGTISDFHGGDNYLFGREILAAGPIHKEMLTVIQSKW